MVEISNPTTQQWHNALASAYKAPPGDSRSYAMRKLANEDATLVQRFPADLSNRVPQIGVHKWLPAGKEYYNNWLSSVGLPESAKAYTQLEDAVKKFCWEIEQGSESLWSSSSTKQWTDAGDLTKLFMQNVFTLARPFFDAVAAETPLYRFFVTDRPDPSAPCQDAMVYIMRETVATKQLQVLLVIAIRPWIDSTVLRDQISKLEPKACSPYTVVHELARQLELTQAALAAVFTGTDVVLFQRLSDNSQQSHNGRFWYHRKGQRRIMRLSRCDKPSVDGALIDLVALLPQAVHMIEADRINRVDAHEDLFERSAISDRRLGYLWKLKRQLSLITVTGACPSSTITKINETAGPNILGDEVAHDVVYVAFGSARRARGDAGPTQYLLQCDHPAKYKGDTAKTYSATLTWLDAPFEIPDWVCLTNNAPGSVIEQDKLYAIDAGLIKVLLSDALERSNSSVRSWQRVFVKLPKTRGRIGFGHSGQAKFLEEVDARFETERETWCLDGGRDASGPFGNVELFPHQIVTLGLSPSAAMARYIDEEGGQAAGQVFKGRYSVTKDHGPSFAMIIQALQCTVPQGSELSLHPDLGDVIRALRSTGEQVGKVVDSLQEEAEKKLAGIHACGLVHFSIKARNMCLRLKTEEEGVLEPETEWHLLSPQTVASEGSWDRISEAGSTWSCDQSAKEEPKSAESEARPSLPLFEVQFIDFERSCWREDSFAREYDKMMLGQVFTSLREACGVWGQMNRQLAESQSGT